MSDDATDFKFYDNGEKKDTRHWDFERYYRIERIVAVFVIALVVSMFLLVVAVVVVPILGCL
jgi:type IV secretory pathway component VirB8